MALSKTCPAAEFRESRSPNKKKPRFHPSKKKPRARAGSPEREAVFGSSLSGGIETKDKTLTRRHGDAIAAEKTPRRSGAIPDVKTYYASIDYFILVDPEAQKLLHLKRKKHAVSERHTKTKKTKPQTARLHTENHTTRHKSLTPQPVRKNRLDSE